MSNENDRFNPTFKIGDTEGGNKKRFTIIKVIDIYEGMGHQIFTEIKDDSKNTYKNTGWLKFPSFKNSHNYYEINYIRTINVE